MAPPARAPRIPDREPPGRVRVPGRRRPRDGPPPAGAPGTAPDPRPADLPRRRAPAPPLRRPPAPTPARRRARAGTRPHAPAVHPATRPARTTRAGTGDSPVRGPPAPGNPHRVRGSIDRPFGGSPSITPNDKAPTATGGGAGGSTRATGRRPPSPRSQHPHTC